ncbi:MAG TPA: hypothetical protein VGJ07_28935 [Rugosimonospora sp.]|jgi:hypothetical protein
MSAHAVRPRDRAVPAARTLPPVRFRDLLAAEWIKMRSLRSTFWSFAFVTLFVIGSAALAAIGDYRNFPHYSAQMQREHGFALSDAFPSAGYLGLMLFAASMGAIVIVSEYGSGLIRTTTAAVPARGSVVLAKAVVVAAVWTVVGAALAAGAFVVSQAILDGRHAGVPITHPGALRGLVACTLLGPVCALIGLGLGVLIRHSATTIVTGAFTILMLPTFFSQGRRWSADVNHLMVYPAWWRLTIVLGPVAPGDFQFASVAESWIVYAAWPAVAIVVAVLAVRRRDV